MPDDDIIKVDMNFTVKLSQDMKLIPANQVFTLDFTQAATETLDF